MIDGRRLAYLVLLTSVAPASAVAQDMPSDWRISLTPYLWAPSAKIDIRSPGTGQLVEADLSFRDILGHASRIFVGKGEVQRGRIGLMGDLLYIRLGPGKTFDAVTSIRTVAGFYRVYETDPWSVDLLAGARYSEARPEIARSRLDPVIGARARARIGPRSSLTGYADFDPAGADWQLSAAFDYQITPHLTLSPGWRYYALDAASGQVKVRLKGPLVAATYRF